MAVQHTTVVIHQMPGGEVKGSKSYEGGAVVKVPDQAVPADSSEMPLVVSFDVGQLVSLFIMNTKDMTLKTNSSGAPDDTLNLIANVPYIWNTDSLDTCLLTVDVTGLFLTDESSADAIFNLVALIDPTP